MLRYTFVLAMSLVAIACGPRVREQFARDYNCPVPNVRHQNLGDRTARVWGCGREAVYSCRSRRCVREGSAQSPIEDPSDAWSSPPYVAPAVTQASQLHVQRTQHADGYVLLQSKFLVAPNVWMRLVAAPEREPGHLLFELQTHDPNGARWSTCDVRAMTNLVRQDMPQTTHVLRGANSALRVSLPALALLELVRGQQVSLRVCAEVFRLNVESQLQLAAFLFAFVEERRWNESPASGSERSASSARVAWRTDILPMPPSRAGRVLSPEELYKRTAPSVFQVWSCRISLTKSQCDFVASAVAVSSRHLLTNAHVSDDREILWLEGESRRLEARVVAVDEATDRAVLELVTSDQELVPVAGARAFASLSVGEPAFAIGSPKGLDDTLSSGVVSALRRRFPLTTGGVADCAQTSAAISPGSSGGGLFDGRGNLIGITTQMRRDAQNLNFAIAADAFFGP